MPTPIAYGWQVENVNGTPVSGAKIYFFAPGTTTPRTTYTDSGLSVPAAHPVEADAAGWFNVYLSSDLGYDILVKSADDSITYQTRTISSGIAGAQPIDATLTALAGLTIVDDGYIQGTGADTFRVRYLQRTTYAALTAIAAADRFDGMRVYVSARATAGDGGEGWWRFDAASSTTANGGTVLAPDAGTGRWSRLVSGDEYLLSWWPATHAGFVAAIDAAKTAEVWLNGAGVTVTLTSLISLTGAGVYKWDGIEYQKLTQTSGNFETAITISGPGFASPVSLTGNVAVGATSITLTSATGLAAGDIFYLMHDSEWCPAYDVIAVAAGEWITAISVDTGTGVITLGAPLQSSYTTGNLARVYKYSQATEIWMKNVTARGGAAQQQGAMRLDYCVIKHWENMQSYGNQFQSFEWQICVDKYQQGTTYSEGASLDGYGYGQVIGGCLNAGFLSVSGTDARHLVTIGASVQAALPGGTNLYLIGQDTRIGQVHCDNARGDPFDSHFGQRAYWVGSVTGTMIPGTGESSVTLQSPDATIDHIGVSGGDQGIIIQCWGKPNDEPAPYFNISNVNLGRGGSSTNRALLVENLDDATRRVMNLSVGAFGANYPGLIVLDCEQGDINMNVGHLTGVSRTTHTVDLISYTNGRPRLTIARNDAIEDSGNAAVYLVQADGSAYEAANAGVFGAFCDILTGNPTADNTAYRANDALIQVGKSRGTRTVSLAGIGQVLPGTYTPTLTNTSNISASSANICSVSQEGNLVTVTGSVSVTPTGVGDISLGISLPIASAFTNATDADGIATLTNNAGYGALIADATNDRLTLSGNATATGARTWRFTAQYKVI
jgi:hypothetical protein